MASALLGGLKAAVNAVRARIAAMLNTQISTTGSRWKDSRVMRNGGRALITQSKAAAIIATQQTIKGTGRMSLNALSDSVTRNNATPKTTTARRKRSRRPSREGIARNMAA